MNKVLLVAALLVFAAAAVGLTAGQIVLVPAGLALLTAALLLG
jgi:hypothetical protein